MNSNLKDSAVVASAREDQFSIIQTVAEYIFCTAKSMGGSMR
jgi:hypothetical protein